MKVLKCIPKASRYLSIRKLASILDAVVKNNDHVSWVHLLHFGARCLRHPDRGRKLLTLATSVNKQLRDEADLPSILVATSRSRRKKSVPRDFNTSLSARLVSKLEEGDYRGAVRMASSDGTLADMSDTTYFTLQQKHPQPHPDSSFPPCPDGCADILIIEEEIAQAIKSFPVDSAGAPDGSDPDT